MILKRRRKDGSIAYGVRGPDGWVGTYDTLGSLTKKTGAKWAEAQAFTTMEATGTTCGDFARQWLSQDCPRTSGRQLKSETVKEYHYRLRAFIKEFEGMALSEVRREVAFEWALRHRHDVPFVAALFSHAHDLGVVAANPFQALGLSKGKGRKHNVPLTETQLHELADASYGVKGTEWKPYAAQFRAFILFQGYTGLRPGETFELRWSDIEGDRIHVARRLGKYGTVDTPKSGVDRTVLLPPPAAEALRTYPRGLELVFRAVRGQRLARGSCFRYFDKVRTAYKRPDLELYELRHFCAHHLLVTMRMPAADVAEQLGHTDGGRLVNELYGHPGHGAIERLEEAWANVG